MDWLIVEWKEKKGIAAARRKQSIKLLFFFLKEKSEIWFDWLKAEWNEIKNKIYF